MMTDISKPAATKSARGAAFAEFWHYFSMNRGAVIGLAVVAIFIVLALFAPWIAPYVPEQQFRGFDKLPPAWTNGGDPRFFLGTDEVGRDILSRLIHGARYSLTIGLVVVTTGIRALRSACTLTTRRGDRPLARAVRT